MLTIILYLFSFIRTLFVFVIVYLIIRWLRNLLNSPGQSANSTNTNSKQARKEGETVIRYNDKGKKIVDRDKGEYVEFEEVE